VGLFILSCIAAAMAVAGSIFVFAGWRAVRALPFGPRWDNSDLPGITVLRPLYRDEPLLEDALLSACRQNYPRFQVVFGIQDATDSALAVAERVRAQMPHCDIAIVRDDTADGANRKVANLQNMLAAAKHEVLVIADSDIHASPDYLRAIAAELATPGTGLVTTLYTGLPANRSLAASLAAGGITYGFLPGAAVSRRLGRQDCLGATMALRARTLAEIGGFPAILNELADDNVLGRLVRASGHRVGLAATIPATTVPETSFAAIIRHELRWARTIRALEPAAFLFSCIQYPLAWALAAMLLSGGQPWACAVAVGALLIRAAAAEGVEAELARRQHGPAIPMRTLLLPLRDLISIGIWVAAFTGDRVEWRGRTMQARPAPAHFGVAATAATEGSD
jgi:ceramide glucosyltransferase